MGRKRKAATTPDERVNVLTLKDTVEYRNWVDDLSRATLIPVATMIRDALAKWAADRGLPAPPTGPGSIQPTAPEPRPKKGGK